VTEEIATNLEEVADATRKLNTQGVGFFFVGLGLGLLGGFYVGYRFNREKLKAEAFMESEREIAKIRESYAQRMAGPEKPDLEEIIEEKGYTIPEGVETPPPVPPPVAPKPKRTTKRATKPSVPVQDMQVLPGEWDYTAEVAKRTDEEPYILHQTEFKESQTGYNQVVYTYYAGDDVLVGEDERPLPHADVIVGQDNLKFGYGADDSDVVFVRNDHLELEMEICRVQRSYEEEVLGLDSHDPPH
jgi:hypothetical protein